MNRLVIDASVAVKWFLPESLEESDAGKAVTLLLKGAEGAVTFLQPPHWTAEVAAVLARKLSATAADNIDELLTLDFVTVVQEATVYRRAIDLAQAMQHHLFDTLYHATALEYQTTLITADRRYYDKAHHLGGIVMLQNVED